MAQDITLLGASYQAVPAVTLPKTGGGTASFTDVTDTTAAAADVATGKYFYTAAGVRTEGTSSGGGGGGDIQYKTGTYTPSQVYDTDGQRVITSISNIGFTPKRFILAVSDRSTVANQQYAVLFAIYEHAEADNDYLRLTVRYSNASNALGYNGNVTNWTTNAAQVLNLVNGDVCFRTVAAYNLRNVEYTWFAFA